MTDALVWLIVVEVVGLAWLPLCIWLFRGLPDRGFASSKIFAILLVTYVTWIVGSVVPWMETPFVPGIVTCAGAGSWWFCRASVRNFFRAQRRVAGIEEAIFLAAFTTLTLLRVSVFDGSIQHTEQFMDLNFLQGSLRSASYPPSDGWMSGHSINYYYFGYLMFAMLTKLSGVQATVAYNLALSTIFASTVAGCFGLGYALVRKFWWAALAPVFVCLLGNWHAILWQLPHSGCRGSASPNFWDWLWQSTRVVDNHFSLADWACNASIHTASNTINEYPLFSFVLGDLHPHVMALPIALTVVALGCSFVLGNAPLGPRLALDSIGRLLLSAVCLGSLFTINSWDYPTYGLFLAASVVISAYLTDQTIRWWAGTIVPLAVLGAASLLFFVPFYAHFTSLAHGVGFVSSPTDLFEFLQVFGFLIVAPALFVLALSQWLRPADEAVGPIELSSPGTQAGPRAATSEAGVSAIDLVLMATVVVVGGIVLHRSVLLLTFGLAAGAVAVLYRVANTDNPNRTDALTFVLVGLGGLVLVLTETIYVRDAFDGGASYRMNTVFKFYYQAWVLLGLAAAYAAYRVRQVLTALYGLRYARLAVALVALGAAGGGLYTWFIPSYAVAFSQQHTLDGMAWVRQQYPDDYAAIQWLKGNVSGTPVVLEATQGEYNYSSRISTYTGLPTVIGWEGHESQWRPGDPDIGRRVADVRSIYTGSRALAAQLLKRYDVRYVVVGEFERQAYGNGPGMRKFDTFLRRVYRHGTTTIYAR